MAVNAARVLMPEAPAHLNDLPQTWKHQIRLARKVRHVKTVAKTHRMNKLPNGHFG